MGRSPCCDQIHGKKGPWTPEEDKKLVEYIQLHGHRSWRDLPKNAGLNRCGKSCRLRWTNYLRPDIKRGKFSADEEQLIVRLHSALGNKWSNISKHLPGRTDNEIKNYWNTHLKKRLLRMGIDPVTHKPRPDLDVLASLPRLLAAAANLGNPLDDALRLHADAAQYLANFQMLQNLVQVMNSSPPSMDATINLLDSATLRRYQLNDLLHATHKLEGLANGSLSLLGLVNPNVPNKFGACPESRIPHDIKVASNTGMINPGLSSYDMPNAHSTPPILVPASPEMETADCMQEQQDPCNLNSLTPCQGLQALNLGELDEDFSWKDIIDQISWSNES